MKIKWSSLIWNLLIPLGIGALAGFLTRGSMGVYHQLNQPPLSPPALAFPIVWTILYLLMGVSAYRIGRVGPSPMKNQAITVYAVQLLFNFAWTIFFFNMRAFWFSFLWLVILWALILIMILKFNKLDRPAALLQLPYLFWVTFAAYLNFGVALLNP